MDSIADVDEPVFVYWIDNNAGTINEPNVTIILDELKYTAKTKHLNSKSEIIFIYLSSTIFICKGERDVFSNAWRKTFFFLLQQRNICILFSMDFKYIVFSHDDG